MRKTKKKLPARRVRAAGATTPMRRFVKLTRAHLEMSGRLTDDEDKRYALTALCIRRKGDAAVVEATNGHMAWWYPAELVDNPAELIGAGELPPLVGEGFIDGERALIDPATAKQCLRALPKHHPREAYVSAYIGINDGVGVLSTLGGASFHCRADGSWPDFDEGDYAPGRQPLCVGLDAALLCKITTWLSKHVRNEQRSPLVLSFSQAGSVIRVCFDVNRDGGPTGTLMPFRLDSDPLSKSMPAWRAAFGMTEEKGGE